MINTAADHGGTVIAAIRSSAGIIVLLTMVMSTFACRKGVAQATAEAMRTGGGACSNALNHSGPFDKSDGEDVAMAANTHNLCVSRWPCSGVGVVGFKLGSGEPEFVLRGRCIRIVAMWLYEQFYLH
jgi:hypothetical protein